MFIIVKLIRIDYAKKHKLMYCPECGSTSIDRGPKGFDYRAAEIGAVAVGPVYGIFAGKRGSNKIVYTCRECGYQWQIKPRRFGF